MTQTADDVKQEFPDVGSLEENMSSVTVCKWGQLSILVTIDDLW